jgi:amidase
MAGSAFFLPHTAVARPHTGEGALSGHSFAVKDMFAIAGHASSAGVPDWQRTHAPAERDASSVARLRAAGGTLVGVTVMDELACSLIGQNAFYGTPDNPRAQGRFCGGSSCGSAAAVAANACDFALGTDTGGSVRVPAALTGLFGMRPTHGAIASDGVVPLAPSLDTIGAFAREGELLAAVMETLLDHGADTMPTRIVVLEDAFARAERVVRRELERALTELSRAYRLELTRGALSNVDLGDLTGLYSQLFAYEAWQTHGAWIKSVSPDLGPNLSLRFAAIEKAVADGIDLVPIEAARAQLRENIARLLADERSLLVLPSVPCVAPYRHGGPGAVASFRAETLPLTAIASLAGAPVLAVPAGMANGAPVGLSFMAKPGADGSLLALARGLSIAP